MGKFAVSTDVSVQRSKADIEECLMRYGATGFMSGTMIDRAIVAFECAGRRVKFVIPLPPFSDFAKTPGGRAWPGKNGQSRAHEQAIRQRWRALFLVIKAKLEAVETGISEFEEEFLANIVLPNGQTLGAVIRPQIETIELSGRMTKVEIGNATLYLGDCLEVLSTISTADAAITDPPFEDEAHTLQRRVKRGIGSMSSEPLPFAPIEDRARYARAMAQVTQGWALAFCQAEAVQAWREAFEGAGAHYRRSMVWIKPDGMPQYSGDRPGMGYESIVSVWCGKGKSRWNGGGRHGVFTCNKNDGAGPAPHPTTKPRRLMEELVSLFTNPGEVVLDPFMGSGTTGVACANLGRRFIGVEIDARYFEIACERIAAAYSQVRLFDDLDRHAPGVRQSDFGI